MTMVVVANSCLCLFPVILTFSSCPACLYFSTRPSPAVHSAVRSIPPQSAKNVLRPADNLKCTSRARKAKVTSQLQCHTDPTTSSVHSLVPYSNSAAKTIPCVKRIGTMLCSQVGLSLGALVGVAHGRR